MTEKPQAHEDEVQFILDTIKEYLTVDVRRSDVLSTWAGIRPLALDPNAQNSESASRDHIITRDPDGLLTVTGIVRLSNSISYKALTIWNMRATKF